MKKGNREKHTAPPSAPKKTWIRTTANNWMLRLRTIKWLQLYADKCIDDEIFAFGFYFADCKEPFRVARARLTYQNHIQWHCQLCKAEFILCDMVSFAVVVGIVGLSGWASVILNRCVPLMYKWIYFFFRTVSAVVGLFLGHFFVGERRIEFTKNFPNLIFWFAAYVW